MVSEDTKHLIENHFPDEYKFDFHKEVEVPVAKRKVKGYLVMKDTSAEWILYILFYHILIKSIIATNSS